MSAEATIPENSETSSMTAGSSATAASPKHKWTGLGYEMVPGMANRLISRYLRGQRRNMIRFFHERRMYEFEDRLQKIRKDSAMPMLEKNRKFQEILNEYATRAVPSGATPTAMAEADNQQAAGSAGVEMSIAGGLGQSNGPGADASDGLPELANSGGDGSDVVIEE
jgi:hypothetical protein